jgi:hypothetical protein
MCCITAAKLRTLGFELKNFKNFFPALEHLSAIDNPNFRDLIGNFSLSSLLVLETGNSVFPTRWFDWRFDEEWKFSSNATALFRDKPVCCSEASIQTNVPVSVTPPPCHSLQKEYV